MGYGGRQEIVDAVRALLAKELANGVTGEQLIEAAGVVVAMQGGPGYVHVPELLEAMKALGV